MIKSLFWSDEQVRFVDWLVGSIQLIWLFEDIFHVGMNIFDKNVWESSCFVHWLKTQQDKWEDFLVWSEKQYP